jgi:hypothetical protein
MKIMVYSTVYGMPASSIQTNVTKTLKPILGPEVGKHLKKHAVITQLIDARDEQLKGLKPGETIEAPTSIEIEVEVSLEEEKEDDCHKVGPRSALATQAQSYEQELMSVLIDVAREREDFRPLLWLHDGAECVARRPNGVGDGRKRGPHSQAERAHGVCREGPASARRLRGREDRGAGDATGRR